MGKACDLVLRLEDAVSVVAGERRYTVRSITNSVEFVPGELLTGDQVNEIVNRAGWTVHFVGRVEDAS